VYTKKIRQWQLSFTLTMKTMCQQETAK